MARKEKRAPRRAERLRSLLEAGDHRAARAEARALLEDPAADPAEAEVAAETLASLAPERGAVVAGALATVAAAALAVWTILQG